MNILKDEKIASLKAEDRERIFPLISIGKSAGGGLCLCYVVCSPPPFNSCCVNLSYSFVFSLWKWPIKYACCENLCLSVLSSRTKVLTARKAALDVDAGSTTFFPFPNAELHTSTLAEPSHQLLQSKWMWFLISWYFMHVDVKLAVAVQETIFEYFGCFFLNTVFTDLFLFFWISL